MRTDHRKRAPRMERTRHSGIYKRGSASSSGSTRGASTRRPTARSNSRARRRAAASRASGPRSPGSGSRTTRSSGSTATRAARRAASRSRAAASGALLERAVPFSDRGKRLAEVERKDVRRYVRHLEGQGLAPSTVVKYLTPLKAMFATAVEDGADDGGALLSNPCAGVRVSRRRADEDEEPEAKAMTRAELAGVLEELPEQWRPFFELLAHTGLRVSEALGLDWPDVEFGQHPRLRVRRQHYRGETRRLKTRSGRRDLPLSPGMARRLWAARPARAEAAVLDPHRQPLLRPQRPPGARPGDRAGGGAVGQLPQLPPHLREPAVRVGQEHPPGLRLAGPRTRRSRCAPTST